MNLLDFFIISIILYFVGFGLYKGLIKSVFSTLGLVGGIALGYFLSPSLTLRLAESMPLFNKAEKLVFILIFILTVLVFRVAGNLLSAGSKMVALGSLNSVLGALLGLAKALTLLLILAYLYQFIIEFWQIQSPKVASQSLLLPKIIEILNQIIRLQ